LSCFLSACLRTCLLLPPAAPACCSCPQRNAKFKHHGNSDFTLNVPEFTCMPGELVAVVGRVGAGKSSLVHAILGNMQPTQGSAEAGGKVSYVPQNPWCQNLSLRDNITFGLPFDEERYSRVSAGWLFARQLLFACALCSACLQPPQQQLTALCSISSCVHAP
jgi:ABC-type nitrate/sulfonate/bicarbonate transport system ATPase subunit